MSSEHIPGIDAFDLIETPENVELRRRLAGIGSRFCAGLFDSLIIFCINLIIFLALLLLFMAGARVGNFELELLLLAAYIVLMFLIYWGYFVFFEMRTNGQTPGKKSQKIRVVKAEGGAIRFTDVAIRNLLRVVDGIGFYMVGGIAMFCTRKSQRLGDLAAGTVVICEAVSNYSANHGKRSQLPQQPEVTAEALRTSGLSPTEFQILNNYWSRREQLTIEARQRLLRTVVIPILKRHGRIDPTDSIVGLERDLDVLMRTPPAGAADEPPDQTPGEIEL